MADLRDQDRDQNLEINTETETEISASKQAETQIVWPLYRSSDHNSGFETGP